MLRYYKDVAMGGVSMVIVEYASIDNDASKASPCQLGISRMDHIPGLSLLAQTIQANGAKAALQISHAGRQNFTLDRPIKAPSTVPWEEIYMAGCPAPDVLTFDEIQQIVKSFGMAAKRAQTRGFRHGGVPCLPRVSHLELPLPQDQQEDGLVRGEPGEPHALPARRSSRRPSGRSGPATRSACG